MKRRVARHLTYALVSKSNSERDIRSDTDRDGEFSEDRDDPEFDTVESLDSDRLHDSLRSLLPKLIQRLSPRQKQLLEAVRLQGLDPSKAWAKRSDWNGLVSKAKRIRKAHSGSR